MSGWEYYFEKLENGIILFKKIIFWKNNIIQVRICRKLLKFYSRIISLNILSKGTFLLFIMLIMWITYWYFNFCLFYNVNLMTLQHYNFVQSEKDKDNIIINWGIFLIFPLFYYSRDIFLEITWKSFFDSDYHCPNSAWDWTFGSLWKCRDFTLTEFLNKKYWELLKIGNCFVITIMRKISNICLIWWIRVSVGDFRSRILPKRDTNFT